ncbi:Rpn family recombination-promoting nuclease/putative transposase [Myxococcota bacterium]|nr:Rpn family recombination-promoting nuclease/putative transposase [Myxococcota bacterium]
MSTTPHDHLFKLVFSEPSELAPVLGALLPPAVAQRLELGQLSPAPTEQLDGDLRMRAPDLLYRAPWRGGGWAEVVFVIEHQSSPDPSMPLRALRTALRVWEQAEGPRLPLVVTLLFAHGAKPWTAPLRLSELYDAPPDAVEPLRGALPELGLVLRDLAVTPDEAMPGEGGGKLALILLRHAHRGDVWDALEANLPLFADAVKRLGDSRAIGLIKYAMHVSDVPWERRLAEKVLPLLQPPTREVIVGYADRRFEEGVAVGNTLGRRDSVLQFYRRRFGALTPAHEAVILNADLPQLERLKDDLFTMNHPDELLTLKTQHES